MTLQAIKWSKANGELEVLDQTLLPAATRYVQVRGVEDGWRVINKMQVRGAPAIAIVGSLSLAVEILGHPDAYEHKAALCQAIETHLSHLLTARPTAVNMRTAADELVHLANDLSENATCTLSQMRDKFVNQIDEMLRADVADNKAIGSLGARDILRDLPEGSPVSVLTHCNTGSLATAGYGTALGVIRSLHESGRLERVYCTETRPYNQGARLTAYELVHDKIPATLICDDMVAATMKTKRVAAVVVGADRIAVNGDTANKIGTYQIAILAKYHHIPFYVAAPLTSVDFQMPDGDGIIIEERSEREMTHVNNERIAAEGVTCWNPAFDVTPASLITGIITEIGIFEPSELINAKEIALAKRISREDVPS
ncbi:PREDICTED: methylthioribose-1-phosphate isomerase [Vollenhovia emeryi]|uniref:methylthioribose-1-phosphate isomerase n=1 Tax=Vollenhovia emeryi TaxID=411798 RepID=UPI0005F43547|nr:PREDICTED: methylthioribose-1-phosphate isomerase [Vollenhovia emeryi]